MEILHFATKLFIYQEEENTGPNQNFEKQGQKRLFLEATKINNPDIE